MTKEPKKPQPGEWWEVKGTRVFVIGYRKNNTTLMFEHECGTIESDRNFGGWKHLPDCTGWLWEPYSSDNLLKIVSDLNQTVYHLTNRVFDLEQKVK
jgi:hypothetical protein